MAIKDCGGFTQDSLDKLECAIAEGVLTVKYQDRSITYRTLKEMLSIRNLMRRKLGLTNATSRIDAFLDRGTC